MKRRDFLWLSHAALIGAILPMPAKALAFLEELSAEQSLQLIQNEFCADALFDASILQPREDDVLATPEEYKKIITLYKRLYRVQKIVGYGYFNTLSFDEMIRIGKYTAGIENFSKEELDFFEELFYEDAKKYGFYGEKVINDVTNIISSDEIVKVDYTGHYLFKGDALETYTRLRNEMGKSVELTSGVRNIVKQMYLFLNKTVNTKGNLSIASRSLAPAGYSYHGISDFDIGKVGFGHRNFTADFAQTQEFKKLTQLGYLKIRYGINNPYGVRYEPWHVKVYDV
ncbi:MAG: hypothetical protein KU37_10055 [Sulfuricurvum sp. PC08-66]|nr:MAG: hypothetical protein KU37_10055 [Sulfuricurvum sp. PC08-66]